MTMLCTVQSTRQPGTWEQVFGVVVQAADFLETVVRLAMGASTGLAVEPGMVGQSFRVLHFYLQLLPCTDRLRASAGISGGGETGWDTAAGERELLTEALYTKQ